MKKPTIPTAPNKSFEATFRREAEEFNSQTLQEAAEMFRADFDADIGEKYGVEMDIRYIRIEQSYNFEESCTYFAYQYKYPNWEYKEERKKYETALKKFEEDSILYAAFEKEKATQRLQKDLAAAKELLKRHKQL